ncbi:hypothetical protein MMC07_004333 [Pseudocyphellaria aurata]|nr:hypothetical protein [Pseudocyphellaria aurata]
MDRDGGTVQLVIAVVFGTSAVVAVVLRIISRRLSRVYLEINDYMIIFALVHQLDSFDTRHKAKIKQFSTICGVAAIGGVINGGAGRHQDELTDKQIVAYWKSMFVLVITWPITQTAIKISILLFYLQLFVTKQFRIAAYTIMFVVCLWCLEQVLATLLICRPISYNWNFKSQKGHCGNEVANVIAGAAVNVFTDLVILLLPMPIIWRLKIPTRSKLSLSFIFGLGFIICIVGAVRLSGLVFWRMEDGTWTNGMAVVWTSLESTLGIICACIVVMRPLFGRAFPDRLKLGEKTKKLNSDPSSTSVSRLSRSAGWMRPKSHVRGLSENAVETHNALGPRVNRHLGDDILSLSPGGRQAKAINTTTVEVGVGDDAKSDVVDVEAQYPNRCLPPGFILVKTEWEVDSLAV